MPKLVELASFFKNENVLVTGGCGFIGSHLVEMLSDFGAIVTVIDNLQAGTWSNLNTVMRQIKVAEGDIRDAAFIERIVVKTTPAYIFNLAANASVPASVKEPGYDFETNCVGTFILLDTLRRHSHNNKKIILASSGAVYGEPKSFPINEDNPVQPISPYGGSKANAEIIGKTFHKVYGLPVTTARLFNTYGPRMARFVILDFLRKLSQNPSCLEVLGNGQQIRDFTYVSDTVMALVQLAISGANGEVYNVSSGISHSVTELAYKMIAALGLEGKTELIYTGSSWVGDAQHWEVSIDKIKKIGYIPQVQLNEGLNQTIHWFQQQNASLVIA